MTGKGRWVLTWSVMIKWQHKPHQTFHTLKLMQILDWLQDSDTILLTNGPQFPNPKLLQHLGRLSHQILPQTWLQVDWYWLALLQWCLQWYYQQQQVKMSWFLDPTALLSLPSPMWGPVIWNKYVSRSGAINCLIAKVWVCIDGRWQFQLPWGISLWPDFSVHYIHTTVLTFTFASTFGAVCSLWSTLFMFATVNLALSIAIFTQFSDHK